MESHDVGVAHSTEKAFETTNFLVIVKLKIPHGLFVRNEDILLIFNPQWKKTKYQSTGPFDH